MDDLSAQLNSTSLDAKQDHTNKPPSRRSNHRRVQGAGWASNCKTPNSNPSFRPSSGQSGDYQYKPAYEIGNNNRIADQKDPAKVIDDPTCPVKTYHQQKVAPVVGKNTETFIPSHEPAQIRVVCAPYNVDVYDRYHTPRDVVVVQHLFNCDNFSIYDNLKNEISSNVTEDVWLPWHGDSHLIANDRVKWKNNCPTFNMVLDKLCHYFKMEPKATRLNWYRDNSEWKPYHHDAAAVDADKAQTQNITVAASFGAEREVAFEHAKTKTTLSIPLMNGSVYSFGKDVNILWRHGIPQLPSSPNVNKHPQVVSDDSHSKRGRFSVIVWGWTSLGAK